MYKIDNKIRTEKKHVRPTRVWQSSPSARTSYNYVFAKFRKKNTRFAPIGFGISQTAARYRFIC
jgi:hypothetical protein